MRVHRVASAAALLAAAPLVAWSVGVPTAAGSTAQRCLHLPLGPHCHSTTIVRGTVARRANTLVVKATIRPAGHRTLQLQMRDAGDWQTIAVDRADATGRATVTAGFPPAYRRIPLRVQVLPTLHHISAVSGIFHWHPRPTPGAAFDNAPAYDRPLHAGITELSALWRTRLLHLINSDRRAHGRNNVHWQTCEVDHANRLAQRMAHAHAKITGEIPNCATTGQAIGTATGSIYPVVNGHDPITPASIYGALLRSSTNQRLLRGPAPANSIGIGAWWAPARGAAKPMLAVVVNIGEVTAG
ncbi:MAG TPA: hypothetical protein VG708_02545 [Mycobacteriales bacterium]|nr:hypothetical protein [Mycobacteriales bacterium]